MNPKRSVSLQWNRFIYNLFLFNRCCRVWQQRLPHTRDPPALTASHRLNTQPSTRSVCGPIALGVCCQLQGRATGLFQPQGDGWKAIVYCGLKSIDGGWAPTPLPLCLHSRSSLVPKPSITSPLSKYTCWWDTQEAAAACRVQCTKWRQTRPLACIDFE